MPRPNLGKICTLWYCTRKHYAHGWCSKHYQNMSRHGQLTAPRQSDLRRALRMVDLMGVVLKDFVDCCYEPNSTKCRHCTPLPELEDEHDAYCPVVEAEHILANF